MTEYVLRIELRVDVADIDDVKEVAHRFVQAQAEAYPVADNSIAKTPAEVADYAAQEDKTAIVTATASAIGEGFDRTFQSKQMTVVFYNAEVL